MIALTLSPAISNNTKKIPVVLDHFLLHTPANTVTFLGVIQRVDLVWLSTLLWAICKVCLQVFLFGLKLQTFYFEQQDLQTIQVICHLSN